MGKNKDLSCEEKATITRELANGKTTLHMAWLLNRDHRTREEDLILVFLQLSIDRSLHLLSHQCQGRHFQQVEKLLTTLEWLYHAGNSFQGFEGNWEHQKTKEATTSIKGKHTKAIVWAKMYLKLDFQNVVFSDECRATLEGRDGFCRGWLWHGQSTPIRFKRQQGEVEFFLGGYLQEAFDCAVSCRLWCENELQSLLRASEE